MTLLVGWPGSKAEVGGAHWWVRTRTLVHNPVSPLSSGKSWK